MKNKSIIIISTVIIFVLVISCIIYLGLEKNVSYDTQVYEPGIENTTVEITESTEYSEQVTEEDTEVDPTYDPDNTEVREFITYDELDGAEVVSSGVVTYFEANANDAASEFGFRSKSADNCVRYALKMQDTDDFEIIFTSQFETYGNHLIDVNNVVYQIVEFNDNSAIVSEEPFTRQDVIESLETTGCIPDENDYR